MRQQVEVVVFGHYILVDQRSWLRVPGSTKEACIDTFVHNHDGELRLPGSIKLLDLSHYLRELVFGHGLELAISNAISIDEDMIWLATCRAVVGLERLDAQLTKCVSDLLPGLVEGNLVEVLSKVAVDRRADSQNASRAFARIVKHIHPDDYRVRRHVSRKLSVP